MQMSKDDIQSLDEILKEFNLDGGVGGGREDQRGLTLWLDEGQKAKYDMIQLKSKKRFIRVLQSLVTTAIERTYQKIDAGDIKAS